MSLELLSIMGNLGELKDQLKKVLPLVNGLISENVKLNEGEQFFLLVKNLPATNNLMFTGVALVIQETPEHGKQLVIKREIFSKSLNELLDNLPI